MNCNILDYGAKQSDLLQTDAIQKAIDDCFLAGGGTVTIPKGFYRTGGVRLRSNVTLYLKSGAVLEGSSEPEDYSAYLEDKIEPISKEEIERFADVSRSSNPFSRWSNGIIKAYKAKNIAVIGEEFSTINGVNCYDPEGEENYRGPHPISFWMCEDITLKGYTIVKSGNWANAIFNSKNITIQNVTVLGGHDGIDIRTCDNVLIEDCFLDTGDDAIAGFDNDNVTVRNCTFGTSCAIFRFAGHNVTVDNIKTLPECSYGLRWRLSKEKRALSKMTGIEEHRPTNCGFLYYYDIRGTKRIPQNDITFKNCHFTELNRIFRLNWNENYKWCSTLPLTGITFKNCRFDNVMKALYIHGDKENPLQFTMEDCVVTAKEGFEDTVFAVGIDYGNVTFKNVTINNYNNPQFVKKTTGEINIINTNLEQVEQLTEQTVLTGFVD